MLRHVVPVAALIAALGACTGSAPEDPFRAALPASDLLEIQVPGATAKSGVRQQALLGQTADFYGVTRTTSQQLSEMARGPMSALVAITSGPASAVAPDHAEWGPFTPALSPLSHRLVVTRIGPDRYQFVLGIRPKTASGPFQPFLTGSSRPGGGELAVDLTLAHALDPVGTRETGAFAVHYDVGAVVTLAFHLDALTGPDGNRMTGDFRYVQAADGAGDFALAAHAELMAGTAGPEQANIHARWDASGAGRADARLAGGDAGAGAQATECWNPSFARVFFAAIPDAAPPISEGSPADCAFAVPAMPAAP